ncbi:tetratricopeptide repeat protein 5 [Biomphalaria pfeifferi]|uniref:Tetratricopeptide repeat protein 5 n=1 Tax=Biomphalaria pfeifferi TaxID=112525 RepID=A0AAD8B1N6_BIOPF|nr:tetratricopeptide repeat protein 5 [Biomphalaria pfeifferi]
MAAGERVLSPTDKALTIVEELYNFRDHYIESHGIEKAGNKETDVQNKMNESLAQLEEVKGDIKNKAQYHLLRGKILNITSKYNQEAEESLSKAVKLDPRLVEAWNHLGECYWKKEDISAAKNCFTGALNHLKNKVSLRNLSMVLRQLSGSPREKIKLIEESVERAKEAVHLDITDGTSWLILGNAYLCQFFTAGQNPKVLKQCMQAYLQAEKDSVTRGNPDLHFNRAVAYQYQEEFQKALDGYWTASQLDPSWSEATTKETELVHYLSDCQTLTESKGKIKAKKLDTFIKQLVDRDLPQYKTVQSTNLTGQHVSLSHCKLLELQPKVNEGKIIVGKVVCTVNSSNPVPFTCCIVDEDQTCMCVTIYNLSLGAGMKIGDLLAIPEPMFNQIKISHKGKEISFSGIRVDAPRLLVVNGRKLGISKEALPVLSVSNVSE